jgi:replicative DNA helicase
MSSPASAPAPEPEPTPYVFDAAFQKKIAGHVLRDEMFMRRADGLVKREYFEDEGLQWIVNYGTEHYKRFQQVPSLPIILNDVKTLIASKRLKGETLDLVKPYLKDFFSPACDLSNRDYMVDQVARFAKKQAFEAAIMKAADLMDKGGDNHDEIVKLMTEAHQVGSVDEGTGFEFWSTAKERMDSRIERLKSGLKNGITTGTKELDDALYHGGWGRGELSVLMGPPKAGKSIGLGEFAINASIAGKNVLYCTLENSAAITGDRMDANASGEMIRELLSRASSVRGTIETGALTAGKLFVHEFPTGTLRPMDVHRLVRKYQSQGIQIDLIVLDYADIMAPDQKTGAENTDSKEVYKGIRAIAQMENLAVLTATQTNRAGAAASVAKITDVSEDINRVRLADVFMILAASDQEKADDQFRLYMAAMRNSESGIMFTCRSDRRRMKFIKSITKESL